MKFKDACSLEGNMTNLDSVLKSRDIPLLTKIHLVMYRYESCTIKKAEWWRTGVFELWSWRRLFSVPWTARKWNQFIINEIHPEYSLEGLMLKLNLQYFGHLMWRTDSLEKTLMLGKTEVVGQSWAWANSGEQWTPGKSGMLQSMRLQRVRYDLATEQQYFQMKLRLPIFKGG